jgi:PAS domain S-box-containing protein
MESHTDSVPISVWIDQLSREEAEETLERLVHNAPGFFYRCKNDETWTMQVLSGHFESITGYDPDDLVGEDGLQYADLIVEDDRERLKKAVAHGLDRDGRFQVSYRIHTAEGEERWLLEHGTGVGREDDGFTHLEGFVTDVTREKTLEHRLRHSQTLEVVGRLAGGVAHDFNNLLSVIIGYSSLVLEDIEDGTEAREDLHEVIEAANRAKELSGQLLSFSRFQANAPEVVSVDPFLRDKVSMISRVLGKDMHVERDLSASDARVEVEKTQLEQVILNLATNARDAMEECGGALRISSKVQRFEPGEPRPAPVDKPGTYVVIDVQDEGEGIAPDVRDKIFEPFFTTKSRERGTGLGLATSCGIVGSAGGSIWFDTEVGEGTTFHVALPTTEREAEQMHVTRAIGQRPKVLIVDDDAKVRDLVARLLRSESINAVTTDGADSARRLWASEGGFDMIIADVVMPDTNGIHLVNDLLAPDETDIPVLFLSGYLGEDVDDTNVAAKHVRFFKKPFTPKTLRETVLELLGMDQDD